MRWQITNWPVYEAGLRRRGDLTVWLDEAARSGWTAPRRATRGGQPRRADIANELVLMLRLIFHLPQHTTLSRRGRAFTGRQARVARYDRPVHVGLGSTGLQLFGQDGWDAEKHGRKPRQWRELHLAIGAETGKIAAHVLSDKDVGGIGALPALLATVEGSIASVIANGACDGAFVYKAAFLPQHDLPLDIIISLRGS